MTFGKYLVLLGSVAALLIGPLKPATAQFQANVSVNAGNVRSTMSPLGLGIHTSPYYNSLTDPNLDDRLEEAGVTTLRAGGGGYADVHHWSITRAAWENGIAEGGGCCGGGLTPWFGNPNDFGYVGGGSDFANFVRLLDRTDNSQAVVTVNYGSALKLVPDASNPAGVASVVPDFGGQPKEAAAWVAYANSDASLYGTQNDITIGIDEQGNDWKTAGYWAKLRASSAGEYQSWAQADGVYDPLNTFLAIDRDNPVGIKYWEIGNETFGTGYYEQGTNGYSVNYDVPYPFNQTSRAGNPDLSPAHYGEEVVEYAQLMKSIDPEIKIGAVLTTPPDDWYWDYWPKSGGPNNPNNKHWNPEVLAQAAGDIDFVMVHWYPWVGEEYNDLNGNNRHDPGEPVNDGTSLLAFPAQKIEQMIEGSTAGVDTGQHAGVRDWLALHGNPDAEIMVSEFNYFGGVWDGGQHHPTDYRSAADALFVADAYSSWLELGVTSVQYLELLTKSFLDDSDNLQRGPAFYGVSLVDKLAKPGDEFVEVSSDATDVRVHAAVQADGSLAVMLLNTNLDEVAEIQLDLSSFSPDSDGVAYTMLNGSSITQSPVSGITSLLDLEVLPRSAVVYVIPTQPQLVGDYNGDGVVNLADYTVWRNTLGAVGDDLAADGNQSGAIDPGDYDVWKQHFGASSPASTAHTTVPEPSGAATLLLLTGTMAAARRSIARTS
ncbi:hypothetical protein [Aeoliella sp.]|uniref:hypothetical protein n=1 Tax=Aeoliella sp. TaxID=2795800 RepID=UPI003CCBE606